MSTYVPSVDTMRRRRDAGRQCADLLTERALETVRRMAGAGTRPLEAGTGRELADGFPPGAGSGPRSSPESTTTEAAVLHRLAGPEPDPRLDVIDRLLANLTKWGTLAVRISADVNYVMSAPRIKGRQSTVGECKCCERPVSGMPDDRLRSGYCHACYAAWHRAGRPGSDAQEPGDRRGQWERARRAENGGAA